jgi:hypothetical protein
MIERERPTRPAETPRDNEPPAEPLHEPEPAERPARKEPPETAREPAPGIRHEPEPNGENIIPTKEGPGTL